MDDPFARRKLVAGILLLTFFLIALIGEAMRDRILRFWIGVILFSGTVLMVSCWLLVSSVFARDLGQWENSSPEIREWYRTLTRPDVPSMICCTEADAYWADEFYIRDGKMYARITDDRPDAPLGRPHIENGTEFEVPSEKLKHDAGNPTGHAVLFVSVYGFTWCYVQGAGT